MRCSLRSGGILLVAALSLAVGCETQRQRSESPRQVVEKLYKAHQAGDLDGFLECLAPGPRAVALGDIEEKGRQGVEAILVGSAAALSEFQVVDVKVSGDTARVVARQVVNGDVSKKTWSLSRTQGVWGIEFDWVKRAGAPAQTPEELVSYDLGAPTWFVCEACGARSTGVQRPTPFQCTKCGKEAVVETVRSKCEACGKTFELFRRRTIMSKGGKRPIGVEIKMPDGQWERGKKPVVKCPGCGNTDAAKLQPVLPSAF